jgi:hypothetical protein
MNYLPKIRCWIESRNKNAGETMVPESSWGGKGALGGQTNVPKMRNNSTSDRDRVLGTPQYLEWALESHLDSPCLSTY